MYYKVSTDLTVWAAVCCCGDGPTVLLYTHWLLFCPNDVPVFTKYSSTLGALDLGIVRQGLVRAIIHQWTIMRSYSGSNYRRNTVDGESCKKFLPMDWYQQRARLTAPFNTNTETFDGINRTPSVIPMMLSDTTRPLHSVYALGSRTDRAEAYS